MNFNFIMAAIYLIGCFCFLVAGVKEEIKKHAPIVYGEDAKFIEKDKLDESCWVRALKRLEMIKDDKDISGARMVIGTEDGKGHAWIEYKRGDEIIKYDPVKDKVIHIEKD